MSDKKSTEPKSGKRQKSKRSIFRGELPLETETTVFILANAFDVFMTYLLLNLGNFRESNALANFFLERFGMNGMIFFKFAIVAFVCVIAQIVATQKIKLARWLLNFGTLLVGLVVIYSLSMYVMYSGKFG